MNWDKASSIPAEIIDWLDNLIEHLSSPLFALLGTLAPFLAPIAVAQFVSAGLVEHGLMTRSEAYWFTIVLEMIGIVAFSEYAATGISMRQRIRKGKKTATQSKKRHSLMGWVCAGYLLFLTSATVVLAWGSPWYEMVVRISLIGVPVMAGTIYGYMRIKNKDKYASSERKLLAQKKRQENRELKLEELRLTHQFNTETQFTGQHRPVLTKACECGCGETFTTTEPRKKYVNNAHRVQAFRNKA
jgi:hypothetical protein